MIKLVLFFVALIGIGVGIAGLTVAASGVIPIEASSGHWAVTEWVLQFSKQRSVATHTIGLSLPPLDDPALVLRGAGHYEGACRPCHGSPELREPRVPRAMLPPPPYLPKRIGDWEPKELFYIVKHGIKFTGMPAWPTQHRDDEVHAMTAFLVKFPALDAESYHRLVYGEPTAHKLPPAIAGLAGDAGSGVPPAAVGCGRCHGDDGLGRENGAFPRLAGQRQEYLSNALAAYARDERHSGTMQPIAAALSEREQREVAQYYARLPGHRPPRNAVTEGGRGREIALRGVPADRVPACASCHGPHPERENPAYPVLSGQFSDYLMLQLELFQRGQRGGSRYQHLMHKVVPRLATEDARAVAAYYAALAPEDSAARAP